MQQTQLAMQLGVRKDSLNRNLSAYIALSQREVDRGNLDEQTVQDLAGIYEVMRARQSSFPAAARQFLGLVVPQPVTLQNLLDRLDGMERQLATLREEGAWTRAVLEELARSGEEVATGVQQANERSQSVLNLLLDLQPVVIGLHQRQCDQDLEAMDRELRPGGLWGWRRRS